MWSLSNKDGVIASGGRYDRLTFTVANGQVTSTINENVLEEMVNIQNAAPYPLADFDGLISSATLKSMKDATISRIAESPAFKSVGLLDSPTITRSMAAHPYEGAGMLISAGLIGMVVMYGIMSLFRPSRSYTPVMDVSTTPFTPAPKGSVEIQLEKTTKRSLDCQI